MALTGQQRSKRYHDSHRDERLADNRERYADDKDKQRARVRLSGRKRAGIKNPTDESRVGTCPICLRENIPLVCDHNHQTGEVRGWPCRRCNRVMGMLRDSVEMFERLLSYLKGK